MNNRCACNCCAHLFCLSQTVHGLTGPGSLEQEGGDGYTLTALEERTSALRMMCGRLDTEAECQTWRLKLATTTAHNLKTGRLDAAQLSFQLLLLGPCAETLSFSARCRTLSSSICTLTALPKLTTDQCHACTTDWKAIVGACCQQSMQQHPRCRLLPTGPFPWRRACCAFPAPGPQRRPAEPWPACARRVPCHLAAALC